MIMRRGIIWAVACMGVLACVGQASGQSVSVYESLDRQKLINSLDQAEMREFLQACVGRLQASGTFDPFELRALQAKLDLIEARTITDPDRRNAEIDKTLAIYRELIDSLTPVDPADYPTRTRLYELQADWAWAVIDDRCRAYTDRLKQLRAGPADYQDLLDLLAPLDEDLDQPVFMLEDLKGDINRTLREIRGNSDSVAILVVPRLEVLQLKVDYYVSWGNYWFVVAMLNEPEEDQEGNDQVLLDAIDYILRFVEDEGLNVQNQAITLTAMCRRQLGQPDQAIDLLRPLVRNGELNVWTRVEAIFETARCFADKGERVRFEEMLRLLETTEAANIGGEGGQVQMLLYTMLLERYYQTVQGDPNAAERVLVEFYTANEDLQWSLLNMAEEMYRGLSDEEAPAIALMARANEAAFSGEEGDLDKALALCEAIEGRSDELAVPFKPQARSLAAQVDPTPPTWEDVEKELTQIDLDPGNEKAAIWAGNAAHKAMRLMAQDLASTEFGEAGVPMSSRELFARLMTTIVTREDWLEADPYLARWHLEQGYNIYWQAAAKELDDQAASDAQYAEAIDAWESYPVEMGEREMYIGHFEARFAALELRRYLFRRHVLTDPEFGASSEARYEAEDLRQMLVTYASEVHARWSTLAVGPDKDILEIWGSKAGLWAAELAYSPVGDVPSASREVNELKELWSANSPVLSNAAELAIRIDVDRGQVEQAMAKLDTFAAENPDRSVELINLVINQIQNRIRELRHEPGQEEALNAQRRSYYGLADQMFAEVESLPVEDRYRETQMYADALSEYAQAEEDTSYAERGLALIDECFALQDAERELAEKAISEEFDALSAQLAEANDTPGIPGRREALNSKRLELGRLLAADGLGPEGFSAWAQVENAWSMLADEGADISDTAREDNLNRLSRELGMAYESRRKALMGRRPVDPENYFGRARCFAAAGDSGKAHRWLQDLSRMLSPQMNPNLYWEAQLERVQAGKDAFWDDADKLKALLGSITQLDDKTGGLFGGGSNARAFRAVRSEIREQIAALSAS